jgi:hypothetical protein
MHNHLTKVWWIDVMAFHEVVKHNKSNQSNQSFGHYEKKVQTLMVNNSTNINEREQSPLSSSKIVDHQCLNFLFIMTKRLIRLIWFIVLNATFSNISAISWRHDQKKRIKGQIWSISLVFNATFPNGVVLAVVVGYIIYQVNRINLSVIMKRKFKHWWSTIPPISTKGNNHHCPQANNLTHMTLETHTPVSA